MNPIKNSLLVLLAITATGAALFGQSPSPAKTKTPPSGSKPSAAAANAGDPFEKHQDAPPASDAGVPDNICFTVEVYALAQDDAAKLLEENPGGEARHAAVLKLAGEGKARFETLLSDVTKSGQRSVLQQVDQMPSPTEFNPPQMPGGLACPTKYQWRDAGDSLEFELVMSPDKTACDVNMSLTSLHFLGFQDMPGVAHEAPSTGQAQFETRKFTTSVTLAAGKTEFLGTFSGPPEYQDAAAGSNPREVKLAFGRISTVTIPLAGQAGGVEGPTLEHQLVFYSLDRESARKILAGDPKAGEYYDAVRALAEKKQAQLERISVLKTKSGQRAVVNEIDEDRHASEFDPKTFEPAVLKALQDLPGQAKSASLFAFTPTAFETRNTGLTFEIEPVAQKSLVDINLNPQLVRDVGSLQANGAAEKWAPMPVFQESIVTTSLTAPMGAYAFIGTFSPPGDTGVNGRKDAGRVWFGFIKTTYAHP